ncbi:hypothetical protein [Jiella sp. M17.18]|uniref:hypothetical protein n=1 Tax=Jiella sp. M17.18 TaxID=3234247 RepID=UPI0034DFD4D0
MTQIDDFSEEDKRWLMHLGYLAQTWATLEHCLDGIVRQLNAGYDAHRVDPVPISFSSKRKYIRKIFRTHPALVQFSEGVDEILDSASRHSEIRNWALHSGMVGNGDAAIFNRWQKAESKHEQRSLSTEDVYAAATGCASLAMSLGILAPYFFGFQTVEQLDEIVSQVLGKLHTQPPRD